MSRVTFVLLLLCLATLYTGMSVGQNGMSNLGSIGEDCGCQLYANDQSPFVCASDGKMYNFPPGGETCMFDCAKKKNPDLKKLNACSHNTDINMVCGSDNNVYRNICEFNCAQGANKDLKVVCKTGMTHDSKICGSDKIVYGMKCLFECAKRKDPGLKETDKSHCN